jgi:hypothetical protein
MRAPTPLFDLILIHRMRAGALTRREAVQLRILMREYRQAVRHGGPMPVLPRHMARRLRLCWIWSAHQLFVDEPGWFMAGLLSVVPASILIVLHYGARALRALGVEGI